MSDPTIHGRELFPGDELGDGVPDCCGSAMNNEGTAGQYRLNECGTCGLVLTVDRRGLIFSIS